MNQLNVAQGRYVVAVSGGVDSIVLLHMLKELPELELVVAHFDHGIRNDSALDAYFVQELARAYDLEVVVGHTDLGSGASEEAARNARYKFLRSVQTDKDATGIILAHHRDDLVETAIINLIRGTGRRGLSSLRSEGDLIRPLLDRTKQDLLDYAKTHNLNWRDDPTNIDTKYLRNKVRLELLPSMSRDDRARFEHIIDQLSELNQKIDQGMSEYLTYRSHKRDSLIYSRYWFNRLPHDFCREIVHHWFSEHKLHNYDAKLVEYVVIKIKTLKPGKSIQLGPCSSINLTKRSIRLKFHNA